MISETANQLGLLVICAAYQAPISESPQVFGGEKTIDPKVSHRPAFLGGN